MAADATSPGAVLRDARKCALLRTRTFSPEAPMISRRALELATGILTGGFGVAVVVQSLDNGIGWSRAGVDSGTFPFLTGIIIVLGSLYNLVRGVVPVATLANVPIAIT